ncbi:MAG: Kae1-associated serine/threonine protein kinase [Candidatus Aenigmarchaeota archaeon]|nr:Kae1-associated serine/threonine protein kinase [Candidatus Aenigmarchaeota archaeon]
MKKLLSIGAEASLYLNDGLIVKERNKKGYRVFEIDERIRKQRTKKEAKLLEKAKVVGVLVPKVESFDKYSISMEFVDGKRLKDILDNSNVVRFSKLLGKMIGALHKNDIVHGDITTSNVIVKQDKLYLIDFGLGYISKAVEDRAVDLHLLEEALESTHSKLKDEFFSSFCVAYEKEYVDASKIFTRLGAIRNRGRYVEK